jgi:hypothetical protein
MAVKKELVDELLKDADPKKVFGSEGLLDDIKKPLAERMLSAELDEHLAGESAERPSLPSGSRALGGISPTGRSLGAVGPDQLSYRLGRMMKCPSRRER